MSAHPLASALAGLARLVSGVRVERRGGDLPHPAVFFANHTSHLDAIVLWSALPAALRARTRPVAARDYWERGRIRPYLAARVFRALLVDRGPASDGSPSTGVEQMIAALDEGDSLILFPEGTRGDGEEIGRFRSGLYRIAAARAGVALVPAHLENLNRILPKGEVLPVPLLSRLAFGAAIALGRDEPKDAFLERARRTVAELGAPHDPRS